MLMPSENIVTTTANWLAQFELALAERDETLLTALFLRDSHWRDVVALTWGIATFNGADAIVKALRENDRLRPASFKIAPGRAAPRQVARAGVRSIEAIFTFETAQGRGSGVLRLVPDADRGD